MYKTTAISCGYIDYLFEQSLAEAAKKRVSKVL
jgi:hypothetical protein